MNPEKSPDEEDEERILKELAQWAGIEAEYWNIAGEKIMLSPQARLGLLEAMNMPAQNLNAARATLDALHEDAKGIVLPKVTVWRENESMELELHLSQKPSHTGFVAEIKGENNFFQKSIFRSRGIKIENDTRLNYILKIDPALPIGYYHIAIYEIDDSRGSDGGKGYGPYHEQNLIVAPNSCFINPDIQANGTIAIALQLYALKSERNCGIGDFRDLIDFADCLPRNKNILIGLNPLHALYPSNPSHRSPYSPSSRFFLNSIYLTPEDMPHYKDSRAVRDFLASDPIPAGEISHIIDYETFGKRKLRLYRILFEEFISRSYQQADRFDRKFQTFRHYGGSKLQKHALYDALYEYFARTENRFGATQWPAEYADALSASCLRFARENKTTILFYEYLQWNLREQLRHSVRELRRRGIHLYQDLAVGVDPGGSEIWSSPDQYARGVSIGAPPDPLAPQGQNWGLSPLSPQTLQANGYEHYRDLIRSNMPRGGALRIDHAVQLMRLYWNVDAKDEQEDGAQENGGGYVNYPVDDLLGILALESVRRKCTLIGEDLGTVPPGFSEKLRKNGLLSYKIAYFEWNDSGRPREPEEYPTLCATALNTHDLPTFAGYWLGRDIKARESIGFFSPQVSREEHERRRHDCHAFLELLKKRNLLPDESDDSMDQKSADVGIPLETMPTSAVILAMHRLLLETPALIKIFSLYDMLREQQQVNLPGTVDEYPNWALRMQTSLEDLRDDRNAAKSLFDDFMKVLSSSC